MKTLVDIQHAHDVLTAVCFDEEVARVIFQGQPINLSMAMNARDVLCWVLEHAHNNLFAANLAALEQLMEANGITMHDLGRVFDPSKERVQ